MVYQEIIVATDALGNSSKFLRDYIRERGFDIPENSQLQGAFDSLSSLVKIAGSQARREVNLRDYLSDCGMVAGLAVLAKRFEGAIRRGFRPSDDWLVSLLEGDPIVTAVGQSKRARNVAWEFLLGCFLSQFAEAVQNKEPDIRAKWRQYEVAVAAKMMYGRNVLDLIKDGVRQLASNTADVNIVAVNAVSAYPNIYSERVCITSEQRKALGPCLNQEIFSWSQSWRVDRLGPWLKNKLGPKPLAVLLFVPTVTFVWPLDKTMFYYYCDAVLTTTVDGIENVFVDEFVNSINAAMQDADVASINIKTGAVIGGSL